MADGLRDDPEVLAEEASSKVRATANQILRECGGNVDELAESSEVREWEINRYLLTLIKSDSVYWALHYASRHPEKTGNDELLDLLDISQGLRSEDIEEGVAEAQAEAIYKRQVLIDETSPPKIPF